MKTKLDIPQSAWLKENDKNKADEVRKATSQRGLSSRKKR